MYSFWTLSIEIEFSLLLFLQCEEQKAGQRDKTGINLNGEDEVLANLKWVALAPLFISESVISFSLILSLSV